ncbi:MAG: hypothetical protein ACYDH3_01435 [Candidatus Aminicenantales bacterium]
MTKRKKTGGTRAVVFILAAVLLAGVFAGFGRAESKAVCQTALQKCLATGMWVGFAAGLWGTFVGAGACILGYDFCRRFVPPVAG